MENNAEERESGQPQIERTQRVMDLIACKLIENSEKENPVTKVPIKLLTSEADAKYSTLMDNSFTWKMDRRAGVVYLQDKGKFRISARTFLRGRGKLDRIEKIVENPEDHIFNKGGVSAD